MSNRRTLLCRLGCRLDLLDHPCGQPRLLLLVFLVAQTVATPTQPSGPRPDNSSCAQPPGCKRTGHAGARHSRGRHMPLEFRGCEMPASLHHSNVASGQFGRGRTGTRRTGRRSAPMYRPRRPDGGPRSSSFKFALLPLVVPAELRQNRPGACMPRCGFAASRS